MSLNVSRRLFVGFTASCAAFQGLGMVHPDSVQADEPVFRVGTRIEPADRRFVHPLDPAIKMAEDALTRVRTQVNDYTCTIIKQERIKDELLPAETMHAEVRSPKPARNGQRAQPLSVYLKFDGPEDMKDRQVIYVKGENNDKMVAREGRGFKSKFGWVWLNTEGFLAMQNQRYPIHEIGIERLMEQLIERGTRDRRNDPTGELTTVRFIEGAKINGRSCTVLEVTHPEQKPFFDFHIARIFIDDELQLPVRYAAYWWPDQPGGRPRVEEAYTYLNLALNVGLKDEAFDHTKR